MSEEKVLAKVISFKCRKCRQFLFTDESVVNAHGESFESSESCCGESNTTCSVWYIREDKIPDWVEQIIIEAEWVRGRLHCPKCSSRFGSFDFVTGSKCHCGLQVRPSIHLSKAKLDCDLPQQTKAEPETVLRNSSSSNFQFVTEPDGLPSPAKGDCFSEELPDTEATNLIVGEDTRRDFPLPSHGRQRKRERWWEDDKTVTSSNMEQSGNKTSSSETNVKSDFRETLTCPVCLDIFYVPTLCHPCGHVFCDPCLRRLARNNPNKTLCPMCRRTVEQCTPHKEYNQKVGEMFEAQYLGRKEIEKNNPIQFSPLPWRPKYHFRWFSSHYYDISFNQHAENNNQLTLFGWNFYIRGSLPRIIRFSSLPQRLSTLWVLLVLALILFLTCVGAFICIKCLVWMFSLSSEATNCLATHVVLACVFLVVKLLVDQYVVVS